MVRLQESIDCLLDKGESYYELLKDVAKYLERINRMDLTKDYHEEVLSYTEDGRISGNFEAAVMDVIKGNILRNKDFYDNLRMDLQRVDDLLKKVDFYENRIFLERRKFLNNIEELE